MTGDRGTHRRQLLGSRRAQASTIGVVLVLAITLVGSGLIVTYGGQALSDAERATSVSRAEHSLTQLDSRTAMVALGETSAQRVSLGPSGDGQFAANDDDGWLRVVHRNYSGGTDEVIYNATLGSVTYENGDTVVAYQGGGVWRQQGNGTTMQSPPEFHYRAATLTLPVVRVVSESSASGHTDAFITRPTDSRRIYPNDTDPGPDGVGAPYDIDSAGRYDNPVLNGTVEVTVHSEFYQGWAEYFRTRTAGEVSVDHDAKTATVELKTVSTVGDFPLADAMDDDGIDVQGQSPGHSVNDFSVTWKKTSQGTFNNMYFTFHAEKNGHRYEVVVHVPPGTKCKNGALSGSTLEVYTLYRNTVTGEQHEWSNTSVTAGSGPIRLECGPGKKDATIYMDLTSGVNQEYGDVSVQSSATYFDWSGSAAASAAFSHTEDGEPTTFTASDETTTRHLTRHYFALLGDDFTLRAQTGPGSKGKNTIDLDDSGGTLDYDSGSGDSYITYLHITENKVEVDLD